MVGNSKLSKVITQSFTEIYMSNAQSRVDH